MFDLKFGSLELGYFFTDFQKLAGAPCKNVVLPAKEKVVLVIKMLLVPFVLFPCFVIAGGELSPEPELQKWIEQQTKLSWSHLQKNISPQEPKNSGDPIPRKGIVVGALSKRDPDYYFHWVRDSSQVMRVVIELWKNQVVPFSAPNFHAMMKDYLSLTADLQKERSDYGLGEPRYTVEGKIDPLPWSRPQFDGPALRALVVMDYLEVANTANKSLALSVLKKDLDFSYKNWMNRGFDIWEEYKADNYNVRLNQLAAFERSEKFFGKKYLGPTRLLEKLLNDHWDPARLLLRSQLAIEATDGYTQKKTDVDSAVIVTIIDAHRNAVGHSVLDDHAQATVDAMERLFREIYPINRNTDLGLAYGRYPGDVYYGGHPWYLITSYYAQFYYRLAKELRQGKSLKITKDNLQFLTALVGAEDAVKLRAGDILGPKHAIQDQLVLALFRRGELIMKRIRTHTGEDGQLYEQFHKETGKPISSLGIGWAHAVFLSSVMERDAFFKNRP